jgi:hypothetical protein
MSKNVKMHTKRWKKAELMEIINQDSTIYLNHGMVCNVSFRNMDISFDCKAVNFTNCRFKNCKIFFSGGYGMYLFNVDFNDCLIEGDAEHSLFHHVMFRNTDIQNMYTGYSRFDSSRISGERSLISFNSHEQIALLLQSNCDQRDVEKTMIASYIALSRGKSKCWSHFMLALKDYPESKWAGKVLAKQYYRQTGYVLTCLESYYKPRPKGWKNV